MWKVPEAWKQFSHAHFPCTTVKADHMFHIVWVACSTSYGWSQAQAARTIWISCYGPNLGWASSNSPSISPACFEAKHRTCVQDSESLQHGDKWGILSFRLISLTSQCPSAMFHNCTMMQQMGKHVAPGLSLAPKLKYEHIDLIKFWKTCVDLAVKACIHQSCKLANMQVYCIIISWHDIFTCPKQHSFKSPAVELWEWSSSNCAVFFGNYGSIFRLQLHRWKTSPKYHSCNDTRFDVWRA